MTTPAPGPTGSRPAGPTDAAVLATVTGLVIAVGSAHEALAALPSGGGASAVGVVRDHLADAVIALRQARADLGVATRAAGAAPRQDPDPDRAALAAAVLPTVRGPGDVVGLALALEDVLAQTLVAAVPVLGSPGARTLVAALANASAARRARLLLVTALFTTGRPELLAFPPDPAALPATAGTVGSPDARFPTDAAVLTVPGAATGGTG